MLCYYEFMYSSRFRLGIPIAAMLVGCPAAMNQKSEPLVFAEASSGHQEASGPDKISSEKAPSSEEAKEAAGSIPAISFSFKPLIITVTPHPNPIATISSDFEWHTAFKVLVETNSGGNIGNMAFKKKGTLADSAILAAKLWRSVKDDSQAILNRRCGCFSKGAIISSGTVELKDGFIEFPLDPANKIAYASAGEEGSGVTIGLLVKIDSKNITNNATLGFDIQDDRRSFHAFVSDVDGTLFTWPNTQYKGLPFRGPLVTVTKSATASVPILIGIS